MKLSDWAKKQGISYLTAYRWFKDGKLPIKAYQSNSGTIIVQDESENPENEMISTATQTNNIMSLFLKKTVEFSKSNASIEDFAAYILSNFSLKLNSALDHPRYSKVKPKPEEIQKHFQQFLNQKPKPSMFVADPESFDEISGEEILEQKIKLIGNGNDMQNLIEDLEEGISSRLTGKPSYDDATISTFEAAILAPAHLASSPIASEGFKPTQKEIDSMTTVMKSIANQLHTEVVKTKKPRKSSSKKK